ncbi:chaperonin family protein RbcX [Oscillatoria sp. CS-180]|uniref:RuBisCO chaperone RbcX n=1 Tax=Oscillatoria sp. CS-180 TaxID=3021720 RepID=UPI00232E25E4|nr:chaperonin family protein RbcX [Oscillatoria sp. CS-180]MDB9528536.1 chaperonin family protein RbcX [Oscillatoria sp. CS-180]
MDIKQIAKDTGKTLTSYLTYQAVRVVMHQLRELDPPCGYWFNAFATSHDLQNGEAFIAALLEERSDLAIRVMTVRQHLADEIAEYLPEMLTTGMQQANMEHRRTHLERITQISSTDLVGESESSQDLESKGDQSS